MPTYRYRLTADIEVNAPNIMAAERAVRKAGKIRGMGSYVGGVRLPSQRQDECGCRVEVKVGFGAINRTVK